MRKEKRLREEIKKGVNKVGEWRETKDKQWKRGRKRESD
jgi:hypothetical protein